MISETARTSERLFVELHRMIRKGEGDGTAADAIRDRLDDAFPDLTPEERRQLQQLSGDLYLIAGKNVVPYERRGRNPASELQKAKVALSKQRWEDMLEHLRTDLSAIPRSRAAYFRGRGWRELGWDAGALEFFLYAYELEKNPNYFVLAIDCMQAIGHERIQETIEGIERDSSAHPALLYKAALALFNGHKSEQLPNIDQRVIALVERGLATKVDKPPVPSLTAGAFVACGFSLKHLGHEERALLWFDKAISVEASAGQESDAPYIARAFARSLKDPAARADFEKAIELQTRNVWPYFYLTHQALTHGDFSRAASLASAGVNRARANQGELKAKLFEWWAIASAELGKPSAEVGALFSAARSENPEDKTVEDNQRMYEASMTGAGRLRREDWQRSLGFTDTELRAGYLADLRLGAIHSQSAHALTM